MAIDTRPTFMTAAHNYNLRNQGWPTEADCTINAQGGGVTTKDPVQHTNSALGVYPSNADIMYYAKTTNADTVEAIGAYNAWQLKRYSFGNTPAARGHFILNAFSRNRSTVSGIDGLYDIERDLEDDRPISIAFYGGRVWYLMPDGRLYYSQILTSIENASKCYQDADPTAEEINEVIATDGGEINIAEMTAGKRLVVVGHALAVFAENGIWSISGQNDGEGFSAVSQTIAKITDVGVTANEGVIEAENIIYYWSEGGIYTLQADQVTSELTAQNITETTIQDLVIDVLPAAKRNVRGHYDARDKKIYWMYNDATSYDGITDRYKYNRVLILDLVLQAFYTYTFELGDEYPWVVGFVEKSPANLVRTSSFVTETNGTVITDTSGAAVTTTTVSKTFSDIKLKFLTFAKAADNDYRFTYSDLASDSLLDWESHVEGGVNYTSYAETARDIAEDLISEKEGNTIYFFFKRTEENFTATGFDKPSSCLLRTKWDWSDSSGSGRWSDQSQIYRFKRFNLPDSEDLTFDYGFEVVQVIHQARGKGRALSLRFDSEQGKDFHILGWSIPYTLITGV